MKTLDWKKAQFTLFVNVIDSKIEVLFILDSSRMFQTFLLRGSPVWAICCWLSVATGGNQSTRRKPAMFGGVELEELFN